MTAPYPVSKPARLPDFQNGNDRGILSIAGKRERERNDSDQTDPRSERGYEAFRQSFTVPELTMREKVTAGYRNGMLTVHLPKDPAGPIRSVEIDCE